MIVVSAGVPCSPVSPVAPVAPVAPVGPVRSGTAMVVLADVVEVAAVSVKDPLRLVGIMTVALNDPWSFVVMISEKVYTVEAALLSSSVTFSSALKPVPTTFMMLLFSGDAVSEVTSEIV